MRIRMKAVVSSIAGVLVLVVAAGGCGLIRDKRAYDGSAFGVSLDDALKQYRLSLPDCARSDVHFSAKDSVIDSTLYLKFVADRACVDTFLDGLGAKKANWKPRGKDLAFSAEPFQKDFGWTFDPDRLYEKWSAGRDGYGFNIIVDRAAEDDQSVYLDALKNG